MWKLEAQTTVQADLSLRYFRFLLGHLTRKQPTNQPEASSNGQLTLVLVYNMLLFLLAPMDDTKVKCLHPSSLAMLAAFRT